MIPISLIVSLEFVKFFQSWFMEKDVDLDRNGHTLKCNTSVINEELGMIHYIFSDKNIKDMKYKGNGDDHKILSQFFLQKITPLAREGSSYWTTDGMSLVRFDGMQEVKPIEFDILRKARVYVNGDFLPFKQ